MTPPRLTAALHPRRLLYRTVMAKEERVDVNHFNAGFFLFFLLNVIVFDVNPDTKTAFFESTAVQPPQVCIKSCCESSFSAGMLLIPCPAVRPTVESTLSSD